MAQHNSPTDNVKEPIQQAASHPWFERFARFGYAARGLVYFVIGLLAIEAAIGAGGKTTGSKGALQTIVVQPFGKFLLAIIAFGIVGYVLWRLVQAILDPEDSGQKTGAKQIAKRLGYAMSAFAYAGLAATAVKLIIGSGGGGNGNQSAQDWTARFLAQPFGRWMVGAAGIVVIGVGLSFLYKAYKTKFRHKLKWQQMSSRERTWTTRIGKFGLAARGVVFVIIGIFLTRAAVESNASEVKGLGESLSVLAQQAYGQWLLGIVALGLIAYSLYCMIQAKYRQIVH
jgi:hypothetical protein